MNNLALALMYSVIGNVLAWFHMNAQFKWEAAKSHWWIALVGVISIIYGAL